MLSGVRLFSGGHFVDELPAAREPSRRSGLFFSFPGGAWERGEEPSSGSAGASPFPDDCVAVWNRILFDLARQLSVI